MSSQTNLDAFIVVCRDHGTQNSGFDCACCGLLASSPMMSYRLSGFLPLTVDLRREVIVINCKGQRSLLPIFIVVFDVKV